MDTVAGLCVITGACIWINNAARNRPFGLWFFVGGVIVAIGFFLKAVVVNG